MALGSAEHAAKIDGFSDLRPVTTYRAGDVDITVARHAGYCWGVQRAYDQTIAEAATGDGPVVTFGPLIHNPQTIEALRAEHGVGYVENIDDVDQGKVIIRTHGVPRETKQALEAKGLNVIDATCPYVRVTQNYAGMLHKQKYFVVIIGNAEHPEVKGILSYAGGDGMVVYSPADVERIPANRRRIGVVMQSTIILDHANKLIALITAKASELRVFNTICYVTDERQKDAEDVARQTEVVVVVGGKESSNTKKLAVVAEKFGARTQLIEGPADLDFAAFNGISRVGVLAGASTPNWLIDEVVAALSGHFAGTAAPVS